MAVNNQREARIKKWEIRSQINGVVLVVLLLMGLATWRYVAQSRDARGAWESEVACIGEAGDPLTEEELEAYGKLPPGKEDRTAEYLEILLRLQVNYTAAGDLPYLGTGDTESITIPPEPWPQLDHAETFLENYARPIAELHQLTQRNAGIRSDVEQQEVRELIRGGCRMVALHVACLHHRGDYRRAAEETIALYRLADCLRNLSSAQFTRQGLIGMAEDRLIAIVRDPAFPAGELQGIQSAVQPMDWDRACLLNALEQRAEVYEWLRSPLEEWASGEVLKSGIDGKLIVADSYPEECATVLSHYSDIVDAAKMPFPASVAAQLRVSDEIKNELLNRQPNTREVVEDGESRTVKQFRRKDLPFQLLEGSQYSALSITRSVSKHRCAIALLAIERFRREQSRLPNALAELVPEYLDALPADPCDGNPLRFVKNETGYRIYGIGTDLIDNAGDVERREENKYNATDDGFFVRIP